MTAKLDLSELNKEQRAAVMSKSQRLLILAGAGSGKTKVLTSRIAYLLLERKASPESIVGLTFTNKAAGEMRHRIAQFVDAKTAESLTLSTFHSFCMKILRQEIHHLGFTSHFTLYDEQDMNRMMRLIARDTLNFQGLELPSLEKASQAIRHAVHRGIKPEEIQGTGSLWHDQFTQTLLEKMQVGMRAYNALDFDHLLSLTVELFEKHPFILKRYQERYRHLLIDEYQDTNPVQYRLTELLTGTENSLTVVGDDDQSIYGFRGADVSLIQNFQNAEVIKLEQNYRSTNTILRSANAVIKNNTARHEKSLWSNKGDGLPINVFVAPSDELEADAIAHRVATLKNEKNLRWSDIAILYRSNSISSLIEIALLKYQWLDEGRYRQGIPFQVFGGTEFFDKKEVKDIAAYLKVWLNPKDQEALLRIINFPRRGIGETSLDLLTSLSRTHNRPLIDLLEEADSLPLPAKAKEGIRAFLKTRERSLFNFQKEAPAQALELLIQEINYERAIHEEVKSDKMRDLKWDNVQKLVDALERYPSQQTDPLSRLRDFVSSISLNEHTFDKQSQMGNTVSLMTFHSAKGLEFPACFLVAMEDHLLPHERSTTKEALEEERRLMYVALTRAKSILTISMARQRKRLGKEMPSRPSRFLFEIPKELLQTTRWDI